MMNLPLNLSESRTWRDKRGKWISKTGLEIVRGVENRLASAKESAEIADLALALKNFKSAESGGRLGGDVWNAIARRLLFDMAHYLLGNGINQESQMCVEYDPIMEAVDANSIPMVALLLDHGWDLDHVVNVDGLNAVQLAAWNGNAKMFFFLMNHGAKLEQHYRDYELTTDPEGEPYDITPKDVLRYANKGGSQPIIQYILDYMNRQNERSNHDK